jgi:hypothetical protein
MLLAVSIIGCWLLKIKPVNGLSRSWIMRITLQTKMIMT